MAFSYLLYGLALESNLAIPGLPADESGSTTDLHITLGSLPNEIEAGQTPWYESPYLDENRLPVLTIWKSIDGSGFHLVYSDKTEFFIDRTGTRVWSIWPDWLSLENTITYLVGPISAFVLRLRGFVCLHASSILVDNRVLAIVGHTGAGKSTTAAGFVRHGYPMLSEDITALLSDNSKFLVQPGYPRINLWPEAVNSLHGAPDALPRIVPTWPKRYLDLHQNGDQFYKQAAPLGAIYILGNRSDEELAPMIKEPGAQDALISLISNTHGNYLLEKHMRAYEFELLSRLVNQVPVRRVVPHISINRLDRLCETILCDFRRSSTLTRRTFEEVEFV